MTPNFAYVIGFIQADGHLSTKRISDDGKLIGKGKMQISLSIRDKEILPKIGNILADKFHISTRITDTNFKDNFESATLTINDIEVRQKLFDNGIPCGKKSEIVFPPKELEYDCDYWRGIIDGDGSLGLTSTGIPFISLITNSAKLANAYVAFLQSITGKIKTLTRNKRDNCYNIAIWREDAQIVAKKLYYKNCLAIDRKKNKAKEVNSWKRPKDMKMRDFECKKWNDKEDAILLSNNDDQKVASILNRTIRSIKMRRWRLDRKSKNLPTR